MSIQDIIERLEDIKNDHVRPILDERIFLRDIESLVIGVKEELEELIEELKEEGK